MTSLLAGGGIGIGLLMIWLGLFPPLPSLSTALAALEPSDRPDGTASPRGWSMRLGSPLTPLMRSFGLPRAGILSDLAICGRTADAHVAEQATAAVFGGLLPPALAGLLALAGAPWPWAVPVWGSIAGAVGGFVLPDVLLRNSARALRTDVAYALSAFLDVTVIALAGGAGVEQALTQAAAAGHGWAHGRLRRAIDVARLTRRPIWQGLDELGAQLGVDELVELATSMRLAGEEGARIRSSLTARAAGLRLHQLSETETRASQATERMSLPIVLMLAGFLVLLGYPAVSAVLTDL